MVSVHQAKLHVAAIPEELTGRHQWVTWQSETRGKGGKPTKIPYNPVTGKWAKSNDPATWNPLQVCLQHLQEYDGVGYCLSAEDHLTGIDLDHCFDAEDQLLPWAAEIVAHFAGTYMERSPSGDGLHIWCQGKPRKSGKGVEVKEVEVYSHPSSRYLTVTGIAFGESTTIVNRQASLDWLHDRYFEKPRKQESSNDKACSNDELQKALAALPADDYEIWLKVGMALKTGGFDCAIWDDWSTRSNKYQTGECLKKWETFQRNGIGLGTLFVLARNYGYAAPSVAAPKTRSSAGTDLLKLCSHVELFHTSDDTAYATIECSGHKETHPVESKRFRRWLGYKYFQETGKSLAKDAIQEALSTLEAKALFEGAELDVHLRTAFDGPDIVIDLGDPEWRIIRVTPGEGWRLETGASVKFWRPSTAKPLPIPQSDGSLDSLKQKLHLNEADWLLLRAFVVGVLLPTKDYPILVIQAGQGSGKTTLAEVVKRLLDHQTPLQRSLPKSEQDLAVAAKNSWLLSFDNLSGISKTLSDALCRIATGSGFGARALYTNTEDSAFDFVRPIICNGIDDMARRFDFQDRAIVIHPEKIKPALRRSKTKFWESFNQDSGEIFGALLTLLSNALAKLPAVELSELPRMGDFARLGAAIELALDEKPGTFLQVYEDNRKDAQFSSLESDPFAQAVIQLVHSLHSISCTPTELYRRLSEYVSDKRNWPTPQSLRNRLERLAPALEIARIEYSYQRKNDSRLITLRQLPKHTNEAVTVVTAVTSSIQQAFPGDGQGDGVTAGDDPQSQLSLLSSERGDDFRSSLPPKSSPRKPKPDKARDDSDDSDGFSPLSGRTVRVRV